MCCGGNDIGMWDRAGMYGGGDEPGDVRHVYKKERADGLGGFADALEIDDARISAGARDDHFRLLLGGKLFNFVVVDALVFLFYAVGDEFVHASGEVQRMPMSQVAAMGKIHSQDYIILLESGHVDGDVCGSAGMRLDVGVFRAEEFFRAFNGE